MNYGIPYKGSKNKIAKDIISQLPSAEHFYDLFGGGGAMTHCALLSGKYKYIHYNELNPLVFKAFNMAVNGEFKNETRWISREDFYALRDTDPYVAICFSFGNDMSTYCYSTDCEPLKKAIHFSIFFDDDSLLKEYIDLKDFRYSSENFKERRLELKKYIQSQSGLRNLNTRLQSLESLGRLENLERLDRLEKLDGMKIIATNLSYDEVPIESNSVIYCDPPYMDTTCSQYKCVFDHDRFHRFALEHDAFVSEVSVPEGFRIVWSRELYSKVSETGYTTRKELLMLPKKTGYLNPLDDW